jgi:hypothetical protein
MTIGPIAECGIAEFVLYASSKAAKSPSQRRALAGMKRGRVVKGRGGPGSWIVFRATTHLGGENITF